MAFWHHGDKDSAAMNNRYLDFVQMRGLISVASYDNYLDNNHKKYWYTLARL